MALTSRITVRRKNFIRKKKWSKESGRLTDQQLVAKAHSRARHPPFVVKDLFGVFGIYHNFFWRSILLNSLIWSLGALHYKVAGLLTVTKQSYEVTDAEKTTYKPHRDFEPFNFPPELKYIIEWAHTISEIIGPLYVLLRFRANRRWLMMECCLLYMVASSLSVATYTPVLRLAIIFTSLLNKPLRYVSLLHLSESISPHLLPLAFGIMGVSDCVVQSIFEVCLVFLPTWRYLIALLGLLLGGTGLLYFFCIPPPMLLDITLKDGNKVQEVITTTLHDSGIIDVDALIDDTIFAGRIIVSPWKRAFALLRAPAFRWKYLFLIVLQAVQTWIQKTAGQSLKKRAAFGLTEASLISLSVQGFASLVGIAFLYRFGRRCTVMLHILVSLLGVVFLGAVRLERFDVCALQDSSNDFGRVVAGFWSVILVYCSRVLKLVIRLVLIQHIPVEDHTILFVLSVTASATLQAIVQLVVDLELMLFAYPGRVYMITLFFVMLFTPTVVLLDNCATMPLMSSDFKAYNLKKRPWMTSPQMSDEGTRMEQ